jgi:hypothetical protein
VSQVGDFVFGSTVMLWIAAGLLEGKTYAPAVSAGGLVLGPVVAFAINAATFLLQRGRRVHGLTRIELVFTGTAALIVAAGAYAALVRIPPPDAAASPDVGRSARGRP